MVRHLTFLGLLQLAVVCATQSVAQQDDHHTRVNTAASYAEARSCADAPIGVTAAVPDDRELLCSAAQQALRLLGRCGISLRRPLQVNILEELRHPFGRSVLAFFDIEHEMVLIRPRKVITSLVKDTPFGALPPRELYRSVVVHEIIHGALHQNAVRHLMSYTAGEYLAYALQIESLDPSVRDLFLQSVANRLTSKNFVFSDILLSLDPFLFAAHAYEHFKAARDSCSSLTAVMEGEVAFISPPPY
jgi:hypothetical protein